MANTDKWHERLLSLDVLRSLAIFLVLVTHISPFFLDATHPLAASVFYAFGRLGVPLFVILSGYLMLDRNYTGAYLEVFLRKNVMGLVVAFELWNVLWFLLSNIPGPELHNGFPITFDRMLKAALFVGGTGDALWYLTMIIALYLGLPLSSRAVRRLSAAGMTVFRRGAVALLVYFGTIVPSLSLFSGTLGLPYEIQPVLSLNMLSADVWGHSVWMLYLVAGFAIKHKAFRRLPSFIVWGLFAVGMSALVFMGRLHLMGVCDSPFDYAFAPLVVASVACFEAIDRVHSSLQKLPDSLRRLFAFVSKWSFATYMLHFWVFSLVLSLLVHIGVMFWVMRASVVAVALCCLFVVIIVLGTCVITSRLLGKVRPMARWLFLAK